MRRVIIVLALALPVSRPVFAQPDTIPLPPLRPIGSLAAGPLPGRSSLPPRELPPSASERLAYRTIARAEADKAKVPFDLVDAVMKIESDYVPTRLGELDEIGLMQVRPGTAAMLGLKADEGSLLTPAVNIHYGAAYLGEAWRRAGGDVCRALMKYRAGHGSETMSALSLAYCARAKAHLVAINSPLASGIGEVEPMPAAPRMLARTVPTAIESVRDPSGRPKSGAAFWSAFKARIKRINARIEARWQRAGAR